MSTVSEPILNAIQGLLSSIPGMEQEEIEKLMKPIVKSVERVSKVAGKAEKEKKKAEKKVVSSESGAKHGIPNNLKPWHNFSNDPRHKQLSKAEKSEMWKGLSHEEKQAYLSPPDVEEAEEVEEK